MITKTYIASCLSTLFQKDLELFEQLSDYCSKHSKIFYSSYFIGKNNFTLIITIEKWQ